MDEDELEKLREEKLDEMQEQSDEEREEAREQQKESIKQEAYQHMTQEAISRLGNVRAARPELAHAVSAQIARLGKSGRIDKVDDDSLKDILRELQKDKDQNQGNISFRR
ncbi:MAG: DNA-binding protein [Candidatus Nanosalina sp.]